MDPIAGHMLRGYGPLAVFAALFVGMAGLIPSIEETPTGELAAGPATGAGGPASAGSPTSPGSGPAGGGDAPGALGTVVRSGVPASGAIDTGGPVSVSVGRGRGSCAGRTLQISGDPYSPPCVEFEGDNGGVTWPGVTRDKIVISFRVLDERGFQQVLASLAGAEITDEPEDVRRTVEALESYFNTRMQLYGREMEIVYHHGRGSATEELLGGGQAEAQADAETVAKKIGAFAELAGGTEPYIDALWQQGVMGFGSPYLSREWHLARRPYAWSIATDCSIVAEVAAEVAVRMLAGKAAAFAGPGISGKPREFAGISPENPWYQECHDAAIRMLRNSNVDPGLKINYKLDISSFSNQAANVVAKLKDGGATTIFCGCDPIFPVFLTAKAAEQNYFPEWIHVGTALIDVDVVGQLYDQEAWSHAFGVSALGSPIPLRAGLGYSAYKTVRSDEPAFAVEIIYGQMYMIALGMHMAGPGLTPFTYEQGMRNYGGGTGRLGTWGFPQGTYTPTRDYRVTWWNPSCVSTENDKHGAYVEAYGGRRFPLGQIPALGPTEQPPVFTGGCGVQ